MSRGAYDQVARTILKSMGLYAKLFDCPAEHAVIATTNGFSARSRMKSPARLKGGNTVMAPVPISDRP